MTKMKIINRTIKLVSIFLISGICLSAFASYPNTKIIVNVKMPDSYDINCADEGVNTFNQIAILLDNGDKVYAKIDPTSRKQCHYKATAFVNKKDLGVVSVSGNTTITKHRGDAFYPGCATGRPVILKNNANIALTGNNVDCPAQCTRAPAKPCAFY
jgi:hypothetical protein